MENINIEEWMKSIIDMLDKHFGKNVEWVFHDLTVDYEKTIVDIRNGEITGRKIGDSGDNLGLEVIRGTNRDGNQFGYYNYTDDGRILKSSTVFLRNREGTPVCCLAINEDVTEMFRFEKYLEERTRYAGEPATVVRDVNKLLDGLIDDAQREIGKSFKAMNKDDKRDFIQYLDNRGAFLITRSVPKVCELLNIAKGTFYNYLDMIRNSQ